MKTFHPYITFNGTCEQALNFYKDCFNGRIEFIQYFDEAPSFDSDVLTGKVMHSEFIAEPLHFMACDRSHTQQELSGPQTITLYVAFDTAQEQHEIFEKLSEGGKVHLKPEETIWGSTVAVLTDRYDIHWMLVFNRE